MKNPKAKIKKTLFSGITLGIALSLTQVIYAQDEQEVKKQEEVAAALEPNTTGKPRMLEPYTAKPSIEPPEGWAHRVLMDSEVETQSQLDETRKIGLKVPAYEIYPLPGDGIKIIREPLFNPSQGNKQEKTMGATLTVYLEQVDTNESKLDEIVQAIEEALDLKVDSDSDSDSSKKEKNPKKTD